MNWTTWLKGLVAAFIGGAANGVTAVIVAPNTFNLQEGWTKLLSMCAVSGIVSAALYLKQSPVPKDGPSTALGSTVPFVILALALMTASCAAPTSIQTPEGKRAYTAHEVLTRVSELQEATIQAEASGAIPTATARTVIRFTVGAAEVLKSAPAGWSASVQQAWIELKKEPQIVALLKGSTVLNLAMQGLDLALALY